MRILRFLDDHANIRFGCNPDAAFTSCQLLSDHPLHAPAKPTANRSAIRKLLCPIEPSSILCIGLNYRQHAIETNAPIPQHPVLFMKNPASLNHPNDPIRIPACSNGPEVDYECELAAVIAKPARNVPQSQALDYVLGYTIANDVSARWWQKQGSGGQWTRGKSFDSFCPFGPVLITPDEIPNPQTLDLSTTLNANLMQQANTSDMIFPLATLIAELSKDMTLLPGTLLLTGTPSGVGAARNPPVFLHPGDSITCRINGIGELTNSVI